MTMIREWVSPEHGSGWGSEWQAQRGTGPMTRGPRTRIKGWVGPILEEGSCRGDACGGGSVRGGQLSWVSEEDSHWHAAACQSAAATGPPVGGLRRAALATGAGLQV